MVLAQCGRDCPRNVGESDGDCVSGGASAHRLVPRQAIDYEEADHSLRSVCASERALPRDCDLW